MIVRVLLLLLTFVGVAWVGASLQSARLERNAAKKVSVVTAADFKGRTTVGGRPAREIMTEAADELGRARKWAPLQAPVDSEAGLLVRTGRRAEGFRLLRDFLRREPENSFAWEVYASLIESSSPAEAARARRRVRQLKPLDEPG